MAYDDWRWGEPGPRMRRKQNPQELGYILMNSPKEEKIELVSRIEDIKARMRSLERELAQFERFGDEARFVDGDVIRFTKLFPAKSDGVDDGFLRCTYVTVKTNAGWYVTGQTRKHHLTYDELITFITTGAQVADVQVASGWVPIEEVGQSSITGEQTSSGPLGETNDK